MDLTARNALARRLLLSGIFLLLGIVPLIASDFQVNLLGKFLAYAILAIGLDLIWGYTGILSLGHGVYFGLGAYCMAMYLKLEASGKYLPDFMGWSGLKHLPWFWQPFHHVTVAILLAIFVPMALAGLLGYLSFRSRIRGVYFSILSQGLVIIVTTLFVGEQAYTGGSNGVTSFTTILGAPLSSPQTQAVLYWTTLLVLGIVYLAAHRLVKGRLGLILIGIRDGENRLRFSGINPTVYKTFIYALSAGIAGVAGALFVTQVGIISPTMMDIVPSIEMVLWVAFGGRGTLLGAAAGAILVNAAKSTLNDAFPEIWLIFLGAMFIAVVLLMPRGLAGLIVKLRSTMTQKRGWIYGRNTHPVD